MSGRTRRPTTFPEQVRNWLAHAADAERHVFVRAIGALCSDRSARFMDEYHSLPLSRDSERCVLQLGAGLLLVWQDRTDAPEFFDVLYVGRLPGWLGD